jgi:hypothetical protein
MFRCRNLGWRIGGPVNITDYKSFPRVLNFKNDIFESFEFIEFKILPLFEVQSVSNINAESVESFISL